MKRRKWRLMKRRIEMFNRKFSVIAICLAGALTALVFCGPNPNTLTGGMIPDNHHVRRGCPSNR